MTKLVNGEAPADYDYTIVFTVNGGDEQEITVPGDGTQVTVEPALKFEDEIVLKEIEPNIAGLEFAAPSISAPGYDVTVEGEGFDTQATFTIGNQTVTELIISNSAEEVAPTVTTTTVITTVTTPAVPTTVTETTTEPTTEVETTVVTETVTETVTPEPINVGSDADPFGGEVLDRCVNNAVASPALWLIPVGVVIGLGGKALEPYAAELAVNFTQLTNQLGIGNQFKGVFDEAARSIFGTNDPFASQRVAAENLIKQLNPPNTGISVDTDLLAGAAGAIAALILVGGLATYWCTTPEGETLGAQISS